MPFPITGSRSPLLADWLISLLAQDPGQAVVRRPACPVCPEPEFSLNEFFVCDFAFVDLTLRCEVASFADTAPTGSIPAAWDDALFLGFV